MRFSRFFIRRPVFAIVLSILITVVGAVSAMRLPISEFPEIVPPTVTVKANYPGASAQEIADTVAAPIEQEINGVDGMLYMSSQSVGDGKLTVSVVFKAGTNVEQAQSLVQNRVAVAEARLPDAVRRLGLAVKKASPDQLMVVLFDSPKGTRDQQYISNFIGTAIKDKLARVEGVGDIYTRGARDFSMRIWLDPARVASLGLTAQEVIAAVRQANSQVAAGVLNQPPGGSDGAFQVQVQAQSRLRDVGEFEAIVVAAHAGGGVVRLRDVARVEMGAQDYTESGFVDNRTAIALSISLLPGSNALATGDRVLDLLAKMQADFPQDVAYHTYYNPTEFIRSSIDKVRDTIFEAALLVCLAMLLFLGSWRAAIIPILAIPVSLVGTFSVLAAMGYTLNTLSLFGLVLAIGIVVDDAIVVVENVERHMEEGMSPVAAAQRSMDEVGFALVAIALVLVAVFVPTAFIDGISGMFYRQFAVTIAASTVISALVSLTLSPALAALLLKPQHDANSLGARWMRIFNRGFSRLTGGYVRLTGRILSRRWLMLPVYLVLAGLTLWRLDVTPHGFVPQLDRGYAIVSIQLPAGSTLARTSEVVQDATARLMSHPGVAHTAAFVGTDGATFTSAPNTAVIFTMFKDFGARASDGLDGPAMLGALRGKLAPISAARVMVIPPPSVRGIGTGGGFKLVLRDTGGLGPQALQAAARGIVEEASRLPSVTGAFTPFNAMSPQIKVELDRTKAEYLGVPLLRLNETLQSYMAPVFVNDMNLMGRVWRVTAQADAPYRRSVADLAALKTRAVNGDMVPLGSVATFSEGTAPFRVPRYNLYPAAEIQGSTKPGYSTGQTIAALEELLKARLPAGFDYEWTELALQEKHAGGSTGMVLGLAVLLVYLLLAALFESWLLPLSVVLIVPSCVLATLIGVSWRGLDNNVLTQISIVVLIGLAAKNAILIVEFARQAMAAGADAREAAIADAREAAIAAARTRLRPILMTSLAFLLGAIPLMLSSGPGAEMRQSMGTAVFAGMLGVTVSGLLFTPLFFTLLSRRRTAPLLAATLLALAGCSVGTPTTTRALATAQLPLLPSAAGAPELQAGAPPALWWQTLGDARLEQLVQRAWQDNDDVRIAAARLASASEFAQAARGARLPAADLDVQAGRARLAAIGSRDGQPHIASPVQWNAVFSWELDLFGRVRHSIAAAEATADERAALRDDVRRLILAQVVDAYLVLRGAQQMRASLQEQLSNQSGTLRLVRERENAGRAAPAERMRAEAQMRLASARLPSLNAEERVARNRLATLTGQRLDAPELAALDQPMPLALPQTLLTDEPAHLLLRRPDVRAAERALAAASAREGAAIAERFPRISLGALFGASGVAGDWNGGDAARWHAGAAFTLPLFDGGTRRARARAAGAEVLAAQAGFDKALALALEETDSAIAQWVQLRSRHAELREAHQLAQESARLARVRYQEGAENLLGVLEAERIALATQEQLVTAHRDVSIATAHGYTAMAGGFDGPAQQAAAGGISPR